MENLYIDTKRYASICSVFIIGLGATVLLVWAFQLDFLNLVFAGILEMNPVTAASFVLAGFSLWLQCDRHQSRPVLWIARAAASVVIAISLARLGGLLALSHPSDNLMSPNSAICFLLIGISLLIIDWTTPRGGWPAQTFSLGVATLALFSLVGYGYGASHDYRFTGFVPMALSTAVAFQILSIGLLLSRPSYGLSAVVLHTGLGGMLARRLLPVGIGVPCLLGWLRVIGQQRGWYDTEFGAAFLVAVTVVMFATATCVIASTLNRTDEARQQGILDLARSNQEIHDLYDNAPCGYHSVDANGVVIAINKTELNWLGRSKEEVVGKIKFADLIVPADRELFVESFPAFKRSGQAKEINFEILHKSGSVLPVTLNATAVFDAEGQFTSSRATLTDATERRRIEKTFRMFNGELEKRVAERTNELNLLNAELQDKSQENELFVYSVSHDLRSPLVNLQGFSQELASVSAQLRGHLIDARLPPEAEQMSISLIDIDMQRCIRFIQTSVGRLSGIIDALLRLSRAGRIEHEPQAVDIDHLVGRVVEAMSSVIFDRSVKIDTHPLPPTWGDPTALEQIFANLIGNAVNYLDVKRPGEIEIGYLTTAGGAKSNTYYVRDNGLGIPEAYHAKVFQALKRLHPKVAQGEGIGLALVKRMVDRHGGSIWFESIENVGSTFYIRLPKLVQQELVTNEEINSPLAIG